MENWECDMFGEGEVGMMIVGGEDDGVVGSIEIRDFGGMDWGGEVGIGIGKEYEGNG